MALQGEPCVQAIVLQSLHKAGVVWASGIFSLVQLGADSWPLTLESFLEKTLQGIQAHLRGPRRGATPLTFKQLPPRSRRLPCRRERGIRRVVSLLTHGVTLFEHQPAISMGAALQRGRQGHLPLQQFTWPAPSPPDSLLP